MRTGFRRFFAWERSLAKRQAERQQDRALSEGLEEGCVFCGTGPWAWAYPMTRVAGAADGGEFLLPAWLPVCSACHEDLKHERLQPLKKRVEAAYRKRRHREMRDLLPVILASRAGDPLPRSDAAFLERSNRR